MENAKQTQGLASQKTAGELLDMFFLDMRSALLETAAVMDRIERAEGGLQALSDSRIQRIKEACDLIKNGLNIRAEQFLILFSDSA